MLLFWRNHIQEVTDVKNSVKCSCPGKSTKNVHIVLCDNVSNTAKAMKDADLCGYGCFVHCLQLVVKDGVLCQRAIVDLLAVCRSIVGHFRRSTVANDKLMKIQWQPHALEHNLKQDEPTRWNSSFYMFKSIVEQKMSLAAYGSDGSTCIPVLTSAQLDLANKVLSPVEEIT